MGVFQQEIMKALTFRNIALQSLSKWLLFKAWKRKDVGTFSHPWAISILSHIWEKKETLKFQVSLMWHPSERFFLLLTTSLFFKKKTVNHKDNVIEFISQWQIKLSLSWLIGNDLWCTNGTFRVVSLSHAVWFIPQVNSQPIYLEVFHIL